MSDYVVREYADLVKKLEGRKSTSVPYANGSAHPNGTTTNGDSHAPQRPSESNASSQPISSAAATTTSANADPLKSMLEGRHGLQQLVTDMSSETTRLHASLADLHAQLDSAKAEIEALSETGEHDRQRLAETELELAKVRADDVGAAKLVSRYMSFSQSSTNLLQSALQSTKARHASTLSTLTARLSQAERTLANERAQNERLRKALEEATQDISRATYGRRREIALRMGLLVREEKLVEGLRRWVRRAGEVQASMVDEHEKQQGNGTGNGVELPAMMSLRRLLAMASDVLSAIDGPSSVPSASSPEAELADGSIARLVLAQDTLSSLLANLQSETEGRLELMRQLALLPTAASPAPPPPPKLGQAVNQTTVQSSGPLITTNGKTVSPSNRPEELEAPSSELYSSSSAPVSTSTAGSSLPSSPAPPPPAHDDAPPIIHVSSPLVPPPKSDTISAPTPELVAPIPIPVILHTPPPVVSLTLPDSDPEPRDLPLMEDQALSIEPSATLSTPEEPPMKDSVSESESNSETMSSAELELPEATLQPATEGPASSASPQSPSNVVVAAVPPPVQEAVDDETQQLLTRLDAVTDRYETLQRQLRECHKSLASMKNDWLSRNSSSTGSMMLPAIERLDDYAEDAMVELEIRAADDMRLAEGYKTLLRVSGPMLSLAPSTSEIEAFLDESSPASTTSATRALFARKLDDLQHDIATIKFALHQATLAPPTEDNSNSTSPISSAAEQNLEAEPEQGGWTRWFSPRPASRGPRASTPVGGGASFGTVMTSPSLRSSTSTTSLRLRRGSASTPDDVVKTLDFRIAMPFQSQQHYAGTPPVSGVSSMPDGIGLGYPSASLSPALSPPLSQSHASHALPGWTRARTLSYGGPAVGTRPRTISGVGMGLTGVGSGSRYDLTRSASSSNASASGLKVVAPSPGEAGHDVVLENSNGRVDEEDEDANGEIE
ncbi:hypothetical protein DL93DRAFT_2084809 [Clavulina sp. PMI_390]|nr:hypothetical protein DL93DRAFT_2084809 [Clavulina sp. PMI_390]